MQKIRLELDKHTAEQIVEHFLKSGSPVAAIGLLKSMIFSDPYDMDLRLRMGNLAFDIHQSNFALGTIERSRFLLSLMMQSAPTEQLTAAYFDNLESLLKRRLKLASPGRLFLGIGTGRCGSTSLTAMFRSVPEVCATHENPPMIFWHPVETQVKFHLRRFAILLEYFPVVFDASHWWLCVLPRVIEQFTETKVVYLHRNPDHCVKSFFKIKGYGRNSVNHWVSPHNNVWSTNLWDPAYPIYPIPPNSSEEPDQAKAALIRHYLEDYRIKCNQFIEQDPDRWLSILLESLNCPETLDRLRGFTQLKLIGPDKALNEGSIKDSDSEANWI